MARKLIVEIIGDPRPLERGLKSAGRSTKQFEREMSHITRGTISGTGIFKSFGRSIAFASGGFIAFSGASKFLTDSVNAAREAAVAQRSLAAQMRASGESFQANRKRIQDATESYAKFGFQNDEVVQSLTVLERGTGSLNKALRVQMLTADIARAKNIDLSSAAQVVAKVFGGQETALRRAVPGLSKNAHGWDLIRLAQQKMAGQAAAATTASERFHATLHDTQELIGTALLPVLNKYLDSLAKWLDKMNKSGKLQKDINRYARNGADAFGKLATAVGYAADAYGKLHTAQKWLSGGGGDILGLGKLGFLFKTNVFKSIFGWGPESLKKALQAFGIMGYPTPGMRGPVGRRGGSDYPFGLQGPTAAGGGGGGGGSGPAGIPITLRNQWFDARIARQLDRVQDLSLRKQLNRLKYIAQEVRDRISVTKDLTRRLNLQDQLVGIMRQERDVQKQITDQMKQQADAAKQQAQAMKDRADAIKQAVINRLQGQQQARDDAKAVKDALANLRLYRHLGGPGGIAAATQAYQQALTQQTVDRLTGTKARLTRGPGGLQTFALGTQITINVHGAESPEAVANKVVAIIKRHSRHTSTQTRGPTSGTATAAPR